MHWFADLSSGSHDFNAFKQAGGEAVIIELGDGLGEPYVNQQAGDCAAQARAAGLQVGFYHFNRPRRLVQGNVREEAEWMKQLVDRAGGLHPGDVRIVMDIEATDAADQVDIAAFEEQLRGHVRELFGHEPLLYSGYSYSQQHFSQFNVDLWVAWYPNIGREEAESRFEEAASGLGSLSVLAWQYGGDQAENSPTGGKVDLNVAPDMSRLLIPNEQHTMEHNPEAIERVVSPNGRFVLAAQVDGNLVHYSDGKPDWATMVRSPGAQTIFQGDGNLVTYAPNGDVLWQSQTSGPNNVLAVQDDGNVVIYSAVESATVWAHGKASNELIHYLPVWDSGTWLRDSSKPIEPVPDRPPVDPAPPSEGHPDPEGQIREWGFSDAIYGSPVAAFQVSFAFWDLAVDGVAGPDTAKAAQAVVDNGGRLSEYFHMNEMRSKGDGTVLAHRQNLRRMDQVRVARGPWSPVSAYRDPVQNAAVGGASDSQHMQGTASDIPESLGLTAGEAQDIGYSGIGTCGNVVLHGDVRAEGPKNTTGGVVGNPTYWGYC